MSADLAVTWAHAAITVKNSLTATDAKVVEDAVELQLTRLSSSETAKSSNDVSPITQVASSQEVPKAEGGDDDQADGIDKSVLAIPAPRRYRSREHLRYVARQPCLVCGRKPSDPHHLRHAQLRALGRRASDELALCRVHHRAVHRPSDEQVWWKQSGIGPIKVARRLWKETRG
jgi:hypothetical protein